MSLSVKEALSLLLEAAFNKDADVRQFALSALANGGEPREMLTAQAFLPLLADPSEGVRQQTVALLAFIGDPKVIPNLKKLLNDPDPGVQEGARAAIEQLSESVFDAPRLKKRRIR